MTENTVKNERTTIDEITRRRKAKIEEIRVSKERMMGIFHSVFSPAEKQGKVNNFMSHINTGIAIYDGVMTGLKIMRRARKALGGRNRW